MYEAPLYAGDVFFRQKDYQQAGEWFQKAIAINPNRETAYRYWADALAAREMRRAPAIATSTRSLPNPMRALQPDPPEVGEEEFDLVRAPIRSGFARAES